MKVTFRCKQSGNMVSFSSIDDIESMRKEDHYEEVKDEVSITKEAPVVVNVMDTIKDAVRPRGRPPKGHSAGKTYEV